VELWRGIPTIFFPDSLAQKNIESYVKEFRPRESDIWLLTYPKSGTHWTLGILNMLMPDQDPGSPAGFVELTPASEKEALPSPRILNTHLHLKEFRIPFKDTLEHTKMIHVIREPKDVITSLYHFIKALNILSVPYEGSIHDLFYLFLEGKMPYGSYFDYMLEWWPFIQQHQWTPSNPQGTVLLLKYAQMKADPKGQVKRIADFLGLERDDEFLEKVVKSSSIDEMRKTRGAQLNSIFTEEAVKAGGLYRKGIVGDWQKYFTEEQAEEFDKVFQKHLGHFQDLTFEDDQ